MWIHSFLQEGIEGQASSDCLGIRGLGKFIISITKMDGYGESFQPWIVLRVCQQRLPYAKLKR